MSRRTFSAVRVRRRAPTTRSRAFAAARWWLTGQMPQRRCTITGTSQ
ncbi:MAG: hypothetical protein U0326_31965 [Polyangiales bacterium]